VPVELYYSGSRADILVYVNQRGEALAAEFIEGLSESDQKKVIRLLKEFAERGEIRNREKFKLEQKPIYAFKSYQIRIPCFYLPDSPKRTVVLTHGLIKKADKLPQRELDKAMQICNEVIQTLKKGDALKPADRFKKLLDKYRDDPEYVAEGLLIDINEQIVELLESKKVTRSELAQKLGVSNAYITKLLNGNENLTIKQLVRLVVALGCSVDVAIVPKRFTVDRLPSYRRERREFILPAELVKTKAASQTEKKKQKA